MKRRHIFSVDTPLGYRVTLTRDRWRTIIRFKHPALAGREPELRLCLRSHQVIRESEKNAEVHLFYRKMEQAFLCVVVSPPEKNDRFVVTAYATSQIKKGRELWTS